MKEIILWISKLLTFLLGVFFHTKIIYNAIREKDITWKLDITNSVLCLFHFSHTLFLYGITSLLPNLYEYTGTWYCYFAKEIRYYGALYVTGHSLVVAIMKYMMIVRWEAVRVVGKIKVQKIFFWVNFLHPVLTIVVHLILRPDFIWAHDAYKEIDLCLGDPNNHWAKDSNSTQTKLHNLCTTMDKAAAEDILGQTLYVLKSGGCWIQISCLYLTGWNLFEGIAYFNTFKFMRK